ncbi:zinc transporter ZIP13 [Ciona intestinalis]
MLFTWSRLLPKYLATFVLFVGLASPTEPILSIHRAGRTEVFEESSLLNSSFDSMTISNVPIEQELGTETSENMMESANSTALDYSRFEATILALLSAGLVGMSGIFPLIILPKINGGLNKKDGSVQLQRLLSFAVGGLLGDVFLHLLPESWEQLNNNSGSHTHWPAVGNGLWVLIGLISFCLLEKLFPDDKPEKSDDLTVSEHTAINSCAETTCKQYSNGFNQNENNNLRQVNGTSNGHACHQTSKQNGSKNTKHYEANKEPISSTKIKTSGYLNLLANCVDNFTHGLAVGGSYLVSRRVGVLTTLAILLHEIPHEVGDFAILLRAGFDRWQAAKLQILTAAGGLLGAVVALLAESAKSAGDRVSWILPFTSGGFIYIALCTCVPDLLEEKSPRESCIQILNIILAIVIMHLVSYVG